MINQKLNNQITYDTIRELFPLKNRDHFELYLKRIYKDLCTFENDIFNKPCNIGISKVKFIHIIKLPLYISEKLFQTMDLNKDGYLSLDELVYSLSKLYFGTFEETAKLIFDLYDFDKDGKIIPEDVSMILSFLPLKLDDTKVEYACQMESLIELKEILKNTFKNKLFLKFNDFLTIIQSQSDIYLQLLCYLYQKCPFKNECINLVAKLSTVERNDTKPNEQKNTSSDSNSSKEDKTYSSDSLFSMDQKSTNIKLVSPSKKSRFSSSLEFFKKLNLPKNECGLKSHTRKNDTSSSDNSAEADESSSKINILQKNSKIDCTSIFSAESELQLKAIDDEMDLNSEVKIDIVPSEEHSETDSNSNSEEKYITKQGFLLRPSLSSKNDFSKYWVVLIDKDLYYYADETKEKFIKVNHIDGSFIRVIGEILIREVKYYSFSIISGSKIRRFNCLDREEAKSWVKELKQNTGYKNFFDYYELVESIAEGSFGQVKLGINLVTKEKVAVKVIIKPQIYTIQYESLLAEIEILKVCKHPNIVQYIDHFENSEYLFIVMEYHRNGNLKNYLKSRNFVISEEKIANIAFQIANVLKYLECYGIIHRDIKPENILIVNKNENNGAFKVKIMDFGFGKILGKKEKSIESYGTLSYAAPEILNRKPYNNSVDIWSFGILLYYMTSSACPFDSKNIFQIMKQICNESITFEKSIWEKRSSILKDLIKSCLDKNLLKRINCDEILNHNFIKSHVKINYNIY